ncbi:BLUF domain-containing protein [Hymenobacter sp. BT770]|uniref:BLUF domain-containing protein n=1 Tax=Hymenobacter sp. BT770 TaxID=2886942 RepID=UPI001D0FBC70|nr:BLUF domain-containing protein [Hymenobacter sp. BT770]MCC3153215.1 BLUF domain-containing protein [Hymenobacter sp. BT770]MDO3415311.1 BLUF domain-containing protein [Hymenobacter sp. BT770]
MLPPPPATEAQPRRAIDWALALTANTALSPQRYERQLLEHYRLGELTLDEVIGLLEASQYHVLYRSHATAPFSEGQLQDLLATARTFNAAHRLTGLLLYDQGRFVQVLEGPEAAVRALYARIQRDPRHQHVVTVSEGPGPPGRRFGDWGMAFGREAGPAVARAFDTVLAHDPAPGTAPDPALLLALLQAFGVTPEPRSPEERGLPLGDAGLPAPGIDRRAKWTS